MTQKVIFGATSINENEGRVSSLSICDDEDPLCPGNGVITHPRGGTLNNRSKANRSSYVRSSRIPTHSIPPFIYFYSYPSVDVACVCV